MKKLALALALLAPLALVPRADAARDLGKELALAFVGSCLLALPDLGRIEAMAEEKKWKKLTGDAVELLTPDAPDPKLKGWLVDQVPVPPHFVAITSATYRGEDMAVCKLSNPYAPVSAMFPHLKTALGLNQPIADEVALGQRKRVWEIEFRRRPTIVTLLDSELMSQNGFTVSGLMKAKE